MILIQINNLLTAYYIKINIFINLENRFITFTMNTS